MLTRYLVVVRDDAAQVWRVQLATYCPTEAVEVALAMRHERAGVDVRVVGRLVWLGREVTA